MITFNYIYARNSRMQKFNLGFVLNAHMSMDTVNVWWGGGSRKYYYYQRPIADFCRPIGDQLETDMFDQRPTCLIGD